MIHVVSTGNGSPHKSRCIDSVLRQSWPHEHHYVDAAEQDPKRGALENLSMLVREFANDDIVCMVDGDDYLPHENCLERVVREHVNGAWLTWGSFVFADGRPGIARQYTSGEDVRAAVWGMTHMKTFRAGLFHRIKEEDLRRDGEWLVHARDLAVMFPCYEMCPPARRRFISDVIYVYDLSASFEWSANEVDLAREQEDVRYVRGLPRYETIEAL
jgi:hypothetical protein